MKSRLFVPIVFAGMALAAGVASANPQYWRDNGLLLEVNADPRNGRDFVQVDATRANALELRALNDTVTLRNITLHFTDGRSLTQHTQFVHPGQPILLSLPHNCSAIASVELDYGDPAHRRYDRTPARLQIVPRMTRDFDRGRYASGYYEPRFAEPVYSSTPHYTVQPSYVERQPRRYTVRPRPTRSGFTAGGYIQGSFRF